LSWHHQHPEWPLHSQMAYWGRMIWRSREGAFFFPLDVKEDVRLPLLREALSYADKDADPSIVETFEWKPVSMSGRDSSLKCSDDIKKLMSFAYEWYEYYTEHWGAHPR